MKKIISIALCAFFVLSFTNANAKIRRVGFFGNQINNQDYTSLQAAHDAANAGDTLLIFPGSWSANFSKKLVVIGYGYFTAQNLNLQVITGNQDVTINLYEGSDGCFFQGLDALAIRMSGNNETNDIVINRCNVGIGYGNTVSYKNWQITQSYIWTWGQYSGNSTCIFSNLLVENCFIARLDLRYSSYSGSTGVFKNNVFGTDYYDFRNGAYAVTNNIFLGTGALANSANCIFKNNIASNNIIPSGNGNKPNVDITKVCVGYPNQGSYSSDERFKIKPTGPAAGAGEDGEDCGMFGGIDPYRLSGIPAIPSFYKLSAPSGTADANPYTITFSVRGNN